MKKDFEKYERRGLPGGPNEMISYMTGSISTEGYKSDSPDKYNDFNLIPSGRITMEDVDFPVFGMDNLGNMAAMMPGMNYKFPGSMVFELPMAQEGGDIPMLDPNRPISNQTGAYTPPSEADNIAAQDAMNQANAERADIRGNIQRRSRLDDEAQALGFNNYAEYSQAKARENTMGVDNTFTTQASDLGMYNTYLPEITIQSDPGKPTVLGSEALGSLFPAGGAEVIPFVGEAIDAIGFADAVKDGEYLDALIYAGAFALPVISGAGLRRFFRGSKKGGNNAIESEVRSLELANNPSIAKELAEPKPVKNDWTIEEILELPDDEVEQVTGMSRGGVELFAEKGLAQEILKKPNNAWTPTNAFVGKVDAARSKLTSYYRSSEYKQRLMNGLNISSSEADEIIESMVDKVNNTNVNYNNYGTRLDKYNPRDADAHAGGNDIWIGEGVLDYDDLTIDDIIQHELGHSATEVITPSGKSINDQLPTLDFKEGFTYKTNYYGMPQEIRERGMSTLRYLNDNNLSIDDFLKMDLSDLRDAPYGVRQFKDVYEPTQQADYLKNIFSVAPFIGIGGVGAATLPDEIDERQHGGSLPTVQSGGDRTTALRNFIYDKKRNKPFAQNGKEVDASKTKYVGETDQGGYRVGVDVDRGDRQRSRSFSLEPSGDASYNRSVTTPKGSKSKSIDIVDGEGTKTITRTRNGEITERTKTLGEKRAEKLRNKYERRVNRVFTDPFPEVPNPNEGKYMLDFEFQMGGDAKASQDFLRNWYQNRVLFSPNEEITPEMRQALIDKVNIGPQAQSFPLIFNDAANENILGQSDTLNDAIYIKPNAPLETYLHELTHFAENNPYEQDIDAINYMASLRALTADMPETLDLLSDPRGGMMDERQEAEYITSPTETSARLMTIRERHSDILKPNKIVTKEDLNEIFKREEKLLQEGRPNLDLEQLYRMYGPNGILSILNEYVSAEPQENIYDLPAAQSGTELDTDRLRKGISYVESKDGLYMMNPESTATGLYGQRFSELENQSDLYSGTREEFAKDLDAQDKIFDLRISGGIPGTPGLEQSAYDLTDEYSTQLGNDFDYTADETAALINFLGRQGARVYFGNVLRDGMSLQEALPNLYSGDAKQSNKTPEEYIEEYREAVKKQGGETKLLPKAQEGFEIGDDANLTDFVITTADLETLNAETYDEDGNPNNPYACDPNKGCLASAFDAYDLLVGQRHSDFPTEYDIKGQAQIQSAGDITYDMKADQFYSNGSAVLRGSGLDNWVRGVPYFKGRTDGYSGTRPGGYDYTADSWDIHGILVERGGTSLLTGQNSFNNLSSTEKRNLYSQMTPGTIVGYGRSSDDNGGYNNDMGLADSTHSTIVVGYAEDGVPILYDYGIYRRLDDDPQFYGSNKYMTNITVPSGVAGKNIDYLKREEMYDMPISDFTANMDKVYEDSDRGSLRLNRDRYEMEPFYNSLQSNKNSLMHDLKLTDEEYNSIAKSLIGIAMQETGGGTAAEYTINDIFNMNTPGANTHGLTQLNWNNIEGDYQLKRIAEKYDITKASDLMDPKKAAIASMIYGYRNLAVSKRNYDKGVEPDVRTFKPGYDWKDAVREGFQGATVKYPGPYFITEDNKRINFEDQQTNYSPYGSVTSTFDRDIEDIQADFDKLYPSGSDGPTYTVKKKDGEIIVEKTTVGNAELTDEQKFIYNWNNPGALRTGDAGGLSRYLDNVEGYANDLRYGGATNKELSNYYSSLLRDI